jgi:multidrug transporter EmrE-like cation transporter
MPEVIQHRSPNERLKIVLLFALMISLVEVYAQYSLKSRRVFFGVLGYIVVAMILLNSYNYEALGHMNLVWSCVSIIMCFVIGFFVFKEPFNKYTFLSVCFALIAIYLGHLSDEEFCGL